MKLQAVVSAKYQVILYTVLLEQTTPALILNPAHEEDNVTLKDDEKSVLCCQNLCERKTCTGNSAAR